MNYYDEGIGLKNMYQPHGNSVLPNYSQCFSLCTSCVMHCRWEVDSLNVIVELERRVHLKFHSLKIANLANKMKVKIGNLPT